MARLELFLLGPFQARLDGVAPLGLHAATVRSLLVFLAVEADREHTRHNLAGLLWPDLPDQVALSNLRYTLSDLRRALGDTPTPRSTPTLLVTRETVRLNPAADCWIDVWEFQRLCDAPATPDDSRPACERMQEAARLYRGPFLEGFSLPSSAAFEDWLFWTREQLQRKMVAALRRQIAYCQLAGRFDLAQAAAQRQVQLEPLDEDAHRQLIVALALGGRRSAALRQVEVCRRIMAQELGVDIMPETAALAEAIRAGEFERTVAAAEQVGTDSAAQASDSRLPDEPAHPSVFVARERELAQLERYLEEALQGRGRVGFVCGDAGSGKTTLVREFVRRALIAHPDLVAASGSCNSATGMGDPFLPFREILQMLAGDIEASRAGGAITVEQAQRLWALLPHTVQTLVEQGPGLIDLFIPGAYLLLRADSVLLGAGRSLAWRSQLAELVHNRSDPVLHQPSPQHGNLSEEVTRVLQGVARHSPLILVLDDLQWIDDASINLLLHLGRHLAGSRILLVGAYRSPDIGLGHGEERHPLSLVLNEFQREFGEVEVNLEQARGRAFVDALLDREPNRLDEEFRTTLYQHTGGHALFTVELLRELEERRDLAHDAEGRWVAREHLDWDRIPPRVEAIIAERVGRLPRQAQTLLAAASVEGEEFTAEVTARVMGMDRADVLREMSGPLGKEHRLVRGQSVIWLEPGRRSLSRYRFEHVLFHEYLYQRLDPVERSRLHQMTGEALEEFYGAEAAGIAVQLARHYELAGLAIRAIEHLHIAAGQALRLGAFREAASGLQHGLELLATLPETPERARHELRLRVTLAELLSPVYGVGDMSRMQAATPAISLGQQAGGGMETVLALRLQADVLRGRGDFVHAREMGARMLAVAEATQDRQVALLAHVTQGTTEFFAGHLAQSRAHLETGLSLYRRGDEEALDSAIKQPLLAAILACQPVILWLMGFSKQAEDQMSQALNLVRQTRQQFVSAVVLTIKVFLGTHGVGWRDVSRDVDALQQLVNENGIEAFVPWARFFRGWQLAHQGQVEDGIAMMHRNSPGQHMGGTDLGATMLRAILAGVCLKAGLYEEGLAAVDEGWELRKRGVGYMAEAELCRLQGALTLSRDGDENEKEAEALFLRALALAQEQQNLMWELRATMDLARLWQRSGRTEEATTRLAAVYARFSEGFDLPDLQEAAALLRELARVES